MFPGLRIDRQQDEQEHGDHANNGTTSDKNVLTGQNVPRALFILGHDSVFSHQSKLPLEHQFVLTERQ